MRKPVPWFRVKAYGYGAGLPCHWQGWVVIAIYALVLATVISIATSYAGGHPAAYAAAIAIPTALLAFVLWWKSDAAWRWRWANAGTPRKIDDPDFRSATLAGKIGKAGGVWLWASFVLSRD